MKTTPDRNKKIILLLGDVIIIILSIYLSVFLRFLESTDVLTEFTGASTFIVLTYLASFYIFDLYNLNYRFKSTAYLARFIYSIIAGTAVVTMTFYLLPSWRFGRGILAINTFFITIFVYGWRLVYRGLFLITNKKKNVAILGAGYAGETIYEALKSKGSFSIKGFLDDDDKKKHEKIGEHSIIGKSDILMDMVTRGEIDAVVMAVTDEKKPELLKALIAAKMNGTEIYNMTSLYEELTGKLPVMHLSDGWMAYTEFHGTRKSIYTQRLKRLLDIGLSCCGLMLSSPLSLATALAIKMDSKGPILFRQKRVGYSEEIFELMKFRSMSVDAETDGAVWAVEDDPRVTRVGKIIRKLRIDEIPQMWNVLKGEMSFIGPRPERPEFIKDLVKDIPFYYFRHAVKPGITGWAQVNYRYGASANDAMEKLQYDLYYIKNLSTFLDLHIILRTIRVVLFGKGAR
jgi:sugar transferase (PEP-CTERM system associated)